MDPSSHLADLLRGNIADDDTAAATAQSPANQLACARVTAILPTALEAFELPEVALVWLTSSNVALGGSVPLDLIWRSDLDAMKVRHVLKTICRMR